MPRFDANAKDATAWRKPILTAAPYAGRVGPLPLTSINCRPSCWVFGANLRIVMSSIMRRRNGLIASSVMGMLLSDVRLANPSSSDRTLPRVSLPDPPLALAPYRESGLVHWPVSAATFLCRRVRYEGH